MVPRLLPDRLVPAANTLLEHPVARRSHRSASRGIRDRAFRSEMDVPRRGGIARCGDRFAPWDSSDAVGEGVSREHVFCRSIKDVWEGFGYLRTQRVLLVTFVVDLFAMVFGWPLAVFPALAEGTFGASSIGWLYAGSSIGAVAAGLLSGWISNLNRHGVVIIYSIVIWGAAIAVFAFTKDLWLAVLCLALAGAADLVSAALRMTMLQVRTPDYMRGRMQGVFMVVVAGGPRLGDVRLGVMAPVTAPAFALWSGGLVIIVAMVVVGLASKAFWRYEANAAQPAMN